MSETPFPSTPQSQEERAESIYERMLRIAEENADATHIAFKNGKA